MKHLQFFALSTLIYILSFTAWGIECPDLKKDSNYNKLLGLFDKELSVSPSWPNYRVYEIPLVLSLPLDQKGKGKTCFYSFYKGKNKSFSSPVPYKFENGEYDLLRASELKGKLKSIFQKQRIDEALIMNISIPKDDPFAQKYYYISLWKTILHEGFHFFAQEDSKKYAISTEWPKWANQYHLVKDRDNYENICYTSRPELKKLLYKELNFLIDSAGFAKNAKMKKAEASTLKFLETRYLRRKAQLKYLPKIDCEKFENIFEMEEGIPSFLEIDSLEKFGLLDEKNFYSTGNFMRPEGVEGANSYFYQTTALMLYILKTKLTDKVFFKTIIQGHLLNPKSEKRDVFSLFESFVQTKKK